MKAKTKVIDHIIFCADESAYKETQQANNLSKEKIICTEANELDKFIL
jgi:hypothetical protein